MRYYSAMKGNTVMIHVAIWMNPEYYTEISGCRELRLGGQGGTDQLQKSSTREFWKLIEIFCILIRVVVT